MTREEIAAMYLQVADEVGNGKEWCWHGVDGPLPRFADLVAAAEREACAKLAESPIHRHEIAEKIRARVKE